MNLAMPKVQEDEIYAGILIKEGVPSHHLILLPGEVESVTWDQAGEWAASIGGELPTRKEQALLFANTAEHFQPRWYWSGEQHWFQYFGNGNQVSYGKGLKACARAVRRVPIVYEATKPEQMAPDADGWIKWGGGECPVPVGTLVDVVHRDGDVYLSQPAGVAAELPYGFAEDWDHLGAPGDIVRYRVAREVKS